VLFKLTTHCRNPSEAICYFQFHISHSCVFSWKIRGFIPIWVLPLSVSIFGQRVRCQTVKCCIQGWLLLIYCSFGLELISPRGEVSHSDLSSPLLNLLIY